MPTDPVVDHPYDAEDAADALVQFLLEHPGASWFARVEVVGGCLVCRAGGVSAVWRLSPAAVAGAHDAAAQCLRECRAVQGQPS